MAAPFDNIVQHLFHQPSLHSVTINELEHLATAHPYFAAAHFLLLKKMQHTDHPSFAEQLHKTTVYFNNPLWLQYLLQPAATAENSISIAPPSTSFDVAMSSVTKAPGINAAEPASDASATDMAVAPLDSDVVPEITPSPGSMMDVITAVFSDPNPLYHTAFAETTGEDSAEETVTATEPDNTSAEEAESDEVQLIQEEDAGMLEDAYAEAPGYTFASLDEKEPIPETVPVVAESETDATADDYGEAPVKAVSDLEQVAPTAGQEPPLVNAAESAEHQNESDFQAPTIKIAEASTGVLPAIEDTPETIALPPPGTEEIDAAADHDNTDLPLSEKDTPASAADAGHADPAPAFKTIIGMPEARNDLLFEPYHTVDYFASQGIRLSKVEVDSKDKLGTQLKSFTAWLKSMKKLPQVSIDNMLAQNEESKVVEDANHSIENKEVITEAMAEVFEKQHLYDKAAEIYQKLSLLNPSKSAYFAARMEALKN